MIVVDTNLIGYLLLASAEDATASSGASRSRSTQAEQALRRDPRWAAPLLWRSELRNVLAVQVRAGRLTLSHAQAVMSEAEALMRGREYAVPSLEVLRLAAKSGCTAYDCEFVSLAQDLGVSLVTVDRQVLAAFPETALSLDAFAGDAEEME